MFFKKEREEARKKYNIDVNLDLLKETIRNNQINELRKYLKSYLNYKNYAIYEYLLNRLIDIAIINNDFSFVINHQWQRVKYMYLFENYRFSLCAKNSG